VADDLVVVDRLPTPAEHRAIAEAVGWTHAFDWPTLPASLEGSLTGAVAVLEGRVVGMGRLVGDDVKYFYVQDLAVLPQHQGRGIGRVLLDRLLAYVAETAPASAFVGLFSTSEADALYRENEFSPGDLTGLYRLVHPAGR
jgi:GNAT superfamily N-acetyltransferase